MVENGYPQKEIDVLGVYFHVHKWEKDLKDLTSYIPNSKLFIYGSSQVNDTGNSFDNYKLKIFLVIIALLVTSAMVLLLGRIVKYLIDYGFARKIPTVEMQQIRTLYENGQYLDIIGVSFHVGSGCKNVDAYSFAIEKCKEVFKIAKDNGYELKILDLGSNDGILSLPLMKRFSKNIESLTMYDSSKDCLDWVKSQYKDKYPQISYIVDNVSNVLNYELEPDIVLVGELLEHVENTQEFLSFLMKLANKNTLFYFYFFKTKNLQTF